MSETLSADDSIQRAREAACAEARAESVRIIEACSRAGRADDTGVFLASRWTLEDVEQALAANAPPPPWPDEDPAEIAARAQRLLSFMEELDAFSGPAPEARKSPDPAIVEAWRRYDMRKRWRARTRMTRLRLRVVRRPGNLRRRRTTTTRVSKPLVGRKAKRKRRRSSSGADPDSAPTAPDGAGGAP